MKRRILAFLASTAFALMAAYGFPTKMTESECVAELFRRYQSLVAAEDLK